MNNKMKKIKCLLCKYIYKSGFPFLKDGDRYFIDSEGCFTVNNISIFYCPRCGREL